MRIGEMIDQLESQGLTIDIFAYNRKPTISVFYLDHKKRGNKFIEIHGKKDNPIDFLYENMEVAKQDYYKKYDVSIVKFHADTDLPTYLKGIDENSGDDDYSITRQVKAEDCNGEDIITIAVASYKEVERKYKLKHQK